MSLCDFDRSVLQDPPAVFRRPRVPTHAPQPVVSALGALRSLIPPHSVAERADLSADIHPTPTDPLSGYQRLAPVSVRRVDDGLSRGIFIQDRSGAYAPSTNKTERT